MTILIFEIEEVKKLLAELDAAKTFNTTVEDLFNNKLYPGGVLLNGAGQTEAEALASGRDFWPSDMNIDAKKIRPKFVLSNTNGVFLVTNACLNGSPASRGTVAYAQDMNPDLNSDWFDYSLVAFGGDDCSVPIPYEWFLKTLQLGLSHFKIEVSDSTVSWVNS